MDGLYEHPLRKNQKETQVEDELLTLNIRISGVNNYVLTKKHKFITK